MMGGPPRTVAADACRGDSLPSFLGGGLGGEDGPHLWWDNRDKSLERPSVLVAVDAAVLDRVPHLPRLQLDLHDQDLVSVVCLHEDQPWRAAARVLEDCLDDRGVASAVAAVDTLRG